MFKKTFISLPVNLKLLFLLLISYNTSLISQETYSINRFLGSINESKLVYTDSTTTSLLNDINYSIPIIQSAQFRLETRQFIETFQEYSIRIKPNSFRAKSSQKSLYQSKIEELRINNQIKINEELKNRYLLIIDYIFNEKQIVTYIKRQQQLKDKLEILSHSVYDENFDIKDLIESEEDLLATNLKLIQLQKTSEDQIAYLKEILDEKENSLEINFENLILPEQIINFPVADSVAHEYLFVTLQKLKLNTIDNEMLLSVAESKQFLDFVQAKYIGKSENLFKDNLSIGFGINLPFFGTARQEKSEHYFEKLTKENDLNNEIEEYQLKVNFAKNEFDTSIINYKTLSNQNRESSVSKIYETYRKMEGVSPLLLLKLKIIQNKKEIEILKFEQELYISFIKYLSINETLFQKPYINYLTNSFELLITQ